MNCDTSSVLPIAQRIEDKLRASLKVEHFVRPPRTLQSRSFDQSSYLIDTSQDIVDTSGNCGSSYAVTIVSPDFAKKMTLARHKMSESTKYTIHAYILRGLPPSSQSYRSCH